MTSGRMLSWLGGAGADAVGRLFIQVVVTAVLARLIAPESFGLAALALATIALAATIAGGIPFEEALVRQAGLRRGHLQSALAVSFALAALFTVLVFFLGGAIGAAFGAPGFALLLLATCSWLFAHAVTVILTAWARRRRRFNTIAQASLIAHVIGGVAGVMLGFAGADVWAIVGFRLVIAYANAAVLSVLLGLLILPILNRERLRELSSFARISLAERFTENANYLVFNYAVGAMFGLSALGQFNMAMRIVEPIRGAIGSMSHNLAYPSLMRAARTPGAMEGGVSDAMLWTSLLATPTFLGVASVSPLLVPLLAGPGWDQAVAIAVFLAVGSAIMTSVQALYTATHVVGRPEINLARRIIGVASMVAALFAAAPLATLGPGLARVAGDGAEGLWSVIVSGRLLRVRMSAVWRAAGPPWLSAIAMALAVTWLSRAASNAMPPALLIMMAVAAGGAVYLGLIALVAPRHAGAVRAWIRSRRAHGEDRPA
ncbi:MAG: oligosaccharide flippase family protein [Caulobacterales bacterium]|nr:oligosaccharide flippase family protein [Caulobacterales bacterium]